MSGGSSGKQSKARDVRHRVLTCLYKLSDRDTHSAAASELESIAKIITGDAIPQFISSIAATDSSDKSPVRRQCLRLICVLSEHHGNSLSPYLSKLLSAVVRRLRDSDSSVRSACVAASLSLSSSLSSPVFSTISKPFLEALFIEQDSNAQTGAALCLAAITEGSRNPDAGSLRRLLPKLEKLAKSDSFKAKAALLALIGSIVEVKGVLSDVGGKNVVRNLITLLMEFLISEDWAARKAAAEALMKIATMERDALSEYKTPCLKKFEAKRFDKVKATREMMNQMIEAWKEIPDLPDKEASPVPEEPSSKDNATDRCYQPGSKVVSSVGSTTPQARRRSLLDNPAARKLFIDGSPASITRKRDPLCSNDNKTGRAMFQKLDRKKPTDMKVEAVTPNGFCGVVVCDDSPSKNGEAVREQTGKPEIKCGSQVAPCDDTRVVSHKTGDICSNGRECEDLSLIRKQLLQIENQQSNLMDLLQRFIGSSQNSMHSLEARVHGLELALDEISFDIAISTGRLSQNRAAGAVCCRLPVTEFLSSKLWRKTEPRPTFRPTAPIRTLSAVAVSSIPNRSGDGQINQRHVLQGGRGIILNPLAKVSSRSLGSSEASSSGIVNNTTAT